MRNWTKGAQGYVRASVYCFYHCIFKQSFFWSILTAGQGNKNKAYKENNKIFWLEAKTSQEDTEAWYILFDVFVSDGC